MKILIVKFRTNDLDPSYGKQVEFSSKNVQEFFEFKNTEEYITFVYNDYNFKPSLDKKNIKGYLKLSPARGDYKVYQNLDESLFIKDFFIHELGLSLAANKDDFFTLAKSSSTEYFLSYIPNSSDLGKFISKNNLSGKIIDVQKEELDGAANQSFNANTQLSGIPLQRVVFGAPGTGKSFTINKQSSPFEDQKKISKDKKDEIRNAIAEAITKSRKLTLLNSIGFKYSDELKSIQRKDLSREPLKIHSFPEDGLICRFQA